MRNTSVTHRMGSGHVIRTWVATRAVRVFGKVWVGRVKGDRRGVTALEYSLIAAFIALAIVGGLTKLAPALNTTFSTVNSTLTPAQK